ncbi:MAG: DUF4974 domain-containing protein [Bacteroidales bacterium]|nr:DUF4974 domain-containing protein [Bacteroidales bacterium]
MDNTTLIFTIAKIIANEKLGRITAPEDEILQSWLAEDIKNRELYQELDDDKTLAGVLKEADKFDAEKNYAEIRRIINPVSRGRVVIFRYKWTRVAAAVVLLVAGSFLAYIVLTRHNTDRQNLSLIEPGTQKAVLTTSDNRRVVLGNTKQKVLYTDRHTTIIDTGSTLICQVSDPVNPEPAELVYNQLETPRGGEYTLILPDGSKVILNSQTRLRFPVQFAGNSRLVELEGEAFFEVTTNTDRPFIVRTNGVTTTVYGTSFNISAYRDDLFIQTTLVKGSVGFSTDDDDEQREYKLEPGQQACYNRSEKSVETKEVNAQQVIAWTEGLFVFEHEPLSQIMQKLSRWYDVEYEFKDESLGQETFTGDLERYVEISTILNMISIASDVEFRTEGKKIVIMTEK